MNANENENDGIELLVQMRYAVKGLQGYNHTEPACIEHEMERCERRDKYEIMRGAERHDKCEITALEAVCRRVAARSR